VLPGGALELIDIYGNARIEFRTSRRGLLTAFDADGAKLGRVEASSPRTGWCAFQPLPGGRRYVYAER
jgi:hypothetical protein